MKGTTFPHLFSVVRNWALFSSIVFLFFHPSRVHADVFNPNDIISDRELFDYQSMTLGDIFAFLNFYNSALRFQFFPDYQGKRKHAATIIYQSAIENGINPRFLLTMIQKEQSLVEASNPTQKQYDWAAGYGVCDSCSTQDPEIQDLKGFGTQVHFLGKIQKKYMLFPKQYRCRVNEICVIDGQNIVPVNQATANLYNYTPHIEGNYRFWQIWNKYWGRDYPDGSLLQAENDQAVWYIQDGKKRKITSLSVLLSRFDPKHIIRVNEEILGEYPEGRPLVFPNYSLLRSPDGRIYLLVDDTLRYITSPEVFRLLGYHPDEVIPISEHDLKGYAIGENITPSTLYPTGALLQNKKTGGVYYVQDGVKHPIYDRVILLENFPHKTLTPVSPEELANFITGEPLRLKDATLIKSENSSTVYVISNGKRRPFSSAEVFEKLGYMWENIIVVPERVLDLHPLGEML